MLAQRALTTQKYVQQISSEHSISTWFLFLLQTILLFALTQFFYIPYSLHFQLKQLQNRNIHNAH